MSTVSAAFVKAKRAFGPVLKDKKNPAFKSNYADLSACLEAIDQACLDNGLACYQETFEDQSGVTVETVFLHESGEALRCGRLHVPAVKHDPQGFGSALTYCRRYSLMTACGLAPEDDDGLAAARAAAKQQDEARATWLNGWIATISGAINAGEMKAALHEAVAEAQKWKDADAEQRFIATAEAKVAEARAKAAKEKI